MGTRGRRGWGVWATVGMLISATVAVVAAPVAASAATCATSWKAPVSGAWTTAADWTHGVPTNTTDACITVAGSYTVTVSNFGNAVNSVTVGGTSGTQVLEVRGSCALGDGILASQAGSVIGAHGELVLNTSGCSGETFALNSGVLTNGGVIKLQEPPNLQASPDLSADVVNNGIILVAAAADLQNALTNNGTINLADAAYAQVQGAVLNDGVINATGSGTLAILQTTFTQGSGSTTGLHPVEIFEGSFIDSGTGKGTTTLAAADVPFTGNIAKGQTVVLDASCRNHFAGLDADTSWTNRGTVLLEADGACQERASLRTTGTFTNLGVVTAMPESASPATIEIDAKVIKNRGIIEAGAGTTIEGFNTQFVNGKKGTVAVDVASATIYGTLLFPSDDVSPSKLAGTLTINTAANYWPAAGLTFSLLHAVKVAKTFTNVTGLTRAGQSVQYHVAYAKTGVSLSTS